MKTYQWIILIVSLLLLNNVLLVKSLDVFYPALKQVQEEVSVQGQQGDEQIDTTKKESAREQFNNQSRQTDTESVPVLSESTSANFHQSFVDYSQSNEFQEIMDTYTMNSGKRMMEKMQRYSSMSAEELYDVIVSSESISEQQFAMQGLAQGSMNELSSAQIRNLYEAVKFDSYTQGEALAILVERGDELGIAQAKESILNPGFGLKVNGYRLIPALYDKDPEFVKKFVNELSLDQMTRDQSMIIGMINEPEVLEGFYRRNIDAILESNNSSHFRMPPYNFNLELTSEQQRKALALLSDANTQKRQFGLALVNAIKDPQMLREGYAKLTRTQDQQTMLHRIMQNSNNAEIKSLIRELASNSDNPQIRQISDALK